MELERNLDIFTNIMLSIQKYGLVARIDNDVPYLQNPNASTVTPKSKRESVIVSIPCRPCSPISRLEILFLHWLGVVISRLSFL